MNKTVIGGVLVVAAVVAAFALVLGAQNRELVGGILQTPQPEQLGDIGEVGELADVGGVDAAAEALQEAAADLAGGRGDGGPSYCTETGCVPPYVFSDLPPYPQDMISVASEVTHRQRPFEGFSADLPDEHYYKQPEFIYDAKTGQTIFERKCKEWYIGKQGGYLGVAGYGIYPSEDYISLRLGEARTIRKTVYVYTSCGVVTYQGAGLPPAYPASSEGLGVRVSQDPEAVKNYITITADPDAVLLEPAWPKYRYGWIHKVDVHVTVSDQTPKGNYVVGLDLAEPPVEKSREWAADLPAYRTAGVFGIGKPFYQLFISIS